MISILEDDELKEYIKSKVSKRKRELIKLSESMLKNNINELTKEYDKILEEINTIKNLHKQLANVNIDSIANGVAKVVEVKKIKGCCSWEPANVTGSASSISDITNNIVREPEFYEFKKDDRDGRYYLIVAVLPMPLNKVVARKL